ncbi:hypothetical protein V2K52_11790 [Pseudomonas alliivorans]|nr:hypothetical protein [Pseudomonas alliivorans]MEE4791534.1 hypothetical protein [Pseudomonas alliivorans]MEE4797685.1 hypothetical protein [Pseudomonas alliivorans]MEE4807487.1 hypothetical protein [Pseudomonas alliivorans]MEE4822988.1 hypothetical protein [Pseudomonas alliivorans]
MDTRLIMRRISMPKLMNRYVIRHLLFPLPLFLLCQPVQASAWQICRMELRITDVVKKPYPALQAQILKSRPASPAVECPEEGTRLFFTPETKDYHNPLPRRKWPKKGQSVQVDYRYLDGLCKGDGQTHECRIRHYPLVGP